VGAQKLDAGQIDEERRLSATDRRRAYRNGGLVRLPTVRFGSCVASAGDFNGDRYSDVIVGLQV
jgi:hypothetical protein